MKIRETPAIEQANAQGSPEAIDASVATALAQPGGVSVDVHVSNAERAVSTNKENHAEADPMRREKDVVEPAKGERTQAVGNLGELTSEAASDTSGSRTNSTDNNYKYGDKEFRVTRDNGNAYIRWHIATAYELAVERDSSVGEVLSKLKPDKCDETTKSSDHEISELNSLLPYTRIIPAGTEVYHYSHDPDALIASGEFDPNERNGEFRGDGAMYFTPVPTYKSNCAATMTRDFRVYNNLGLSDEARELLDQVGWDGAAKLGCDGRVCANPDPMTEVSPSTFGEELAVFGPSLPKVGNIRPIASENISSTAIDDESKEAADSRQSAPVLEVRERPHFSESIEFEPISQLDKSTFPNIFHAIKQGLGRPKHLTYNGEPVALGHVLGFGGTKRVFDSQIEGEPVALALPNTDRHPADAARMWQEALREPRVTDYIRNLGFMVNTRCVVTTVDIDGIQFPAITLTRYQDLPFEVRDHKSPDSSIFNGDFFDETLSLGSFIEQCDKLISDTAALVANGVVLDGDSINICRDNDGLHLFLSDLSNAKFATLDEEQAAAYAGRASTRAIDAVIAGLSWEEQRQRRPFFTSDDFHIGVIYKKGEERFLSGSAYQQFTAKVLAECGISS